MKVSFLTLTFLLLCSTQVLALICLTCEDESDNFCKQETECPSSSNFCKTVRGDDDKITRTCEDMCADDLPSTTCCSENWC